MELDVLTFDDTKSLFDFLRDNKALDKLEMFSKTPVAIIPKHNLGYVLLKGEEICGAASLYDEGDDVYLNELFEIMPEHRGKGYARFLYEYMKEDSMADKIHGFCIDDATQSFWEHMGQKCINKKHREMLEICKPTYYT